MAKKRSAELEREIREALAQIPKKPSLKSRQELDAEIDEILAGGLPAERYEVAHALGFQYPKRPPPKKMTITDINISALVDAVLEGGGRATFSNRLPAVRYPHVKRAMAGGLVEVSSPTTLTLTPEGREVVLRRLRKRASPEAQQAIQNLESGT